MRSDEHASESKRPENGTEEEEESGVDTIRR